MKTYQKLILAGAGAAAAGVAYALSRRNGRPQDDDCSAIEWPALPEGSRVDIYNGASSRRPTRLPYSTS